ncbi:MAG: hypothetical protein E7256_03060 [Lachnospiraceae bacterium]|nr:hypothetical protein [Lachnospiraceae bacterium]
MVSFFSKNGDTLKAVPRGKSGEYTIPKGTVTIGDYAFYGSSIKKLTISNGVKQLGKYVFWQTAIQKLSIPDTLNSPWDEYGFFENLQEVTVSDKNKTYASYDGILYDKKLTQIVYFPPDYKRDVLRYPDTVTVVDLEKRNSNVKEVMISKYVNEIQVFSEGNDHAFEKVTVDPENPYYSSYESSLYNKKQTELLLFTKNETAKFPDTLTEINVIQLLNSGVKQIEISKNVQTISTYAHCSLFRIPTLITVVMDADNPYYTYENGLLMNKEKTILYDIDSRMEELIIPDTVEEMDSFICLSYGALKRISIPAKLRKIKFEDYKSYNKRGEIIVNPENESLSAKFGVLYNKDQSELIYYPENKKDKTYVMPETVVSGNLLSVLKNPYVESITLSEKYKSITHYYRQEGYLPAYSDHSVKEFIVGEKSEYFKTVDGVLYDKDMTKLIAYPCDLRNTEFSIPDTVETAYGLIRNPYLEKLHIGKNLKAWLRENQNPGAPIFLTALQRIEVDEENASYTAIDGVLYDKELTTMIVYPDDCRNKVLTIPRTVSRIFVFYREFPYYMNVRSNPYLEEIKVEKGNATFGTDGKYLYTRCGKYPFFQNE